MEPAMYAWLVPSQVAVAERPGGGGRAHRRARRDDELAWWANQGVTAIVSGMRTRHGLIEAALADFRIAWHPLVSVEQGVRELPELVGRVRSLAAAGEVVLVHVDRPGQWLTGVDAALRRGFGLARSRLDALRQATADGLPSGEIAEALLAAQISSTDTGVVRPRRVRAKAA